MEPKKEYWLQSDPQQKGWEPFETEYSAWHYLFGRESDEHDREQHKEAGWYVGYINKWPNVKLRGTPMMKPEQRPCADETHAQKMPRQGVSP